MSNSSFAGEELNYRALYGKIFSALLRRFGTKYLTEVEDAIQNSFLKSLKTWKPGNVPENKENWLFIVARNDVLTQIKNRQKENRHPALESFEGGATGPTGADLRLQTVFFISSLENVSVRARILFVLKHIFGLSIAEISSSTLMKEEAVYKSIQRTKKSLQHHYEGGRADIDSVTARPEAGPVVEEILYAVFNIGFDSFSEKTADIVNKDLCLEALALARLLHRLCPSDSTAHLLALFCFHAARIPAKIRDGKLVSFFNQNRELWSKELTALGFHYLQKPSKITRLYLEAVIAGKYMSAYPFTPKDWEEVARLYETMLEVSPSPVVKLNYGFCLSRTGKTEEALQILEKLEKELPGEHIYLSLVKAKVLKEVNPGESADLFTSVMNRMNQQVRKQYLLENELVYGEIR